MKRIFEVLCTVMVSLVAGLILWICGFIKGMRAALDFPEEAAKTADELDECSEGIREALRNQKKQKRSFKRTYYEVHPDDSEESED